MGSERTESRNRVCNRRAGPHPQETRPCCGARWCSSSSCLHRLHDERMHSFQIVRRTHDLPFARYLFKAAQRRLAEPVNSLDVAEPWLDRRFALPVDFSSFFGPHPVSQSLIRAGVFGQRRWLAKAPEAAGMALSAGADVWRKVLPFARFNVAGAKIARIGEHFGYVPEFFWQRLQSGDRAFKQRSVRRALAHIEIDQEQRTAIDSSLSIISLNEAIACWHDPRLIIGEIDLSGFVHSTRRPFGLAPRVFLAGGEF